MFWHNDRIDELRAQLKERDGLVDVRDSALRTSHIMAAAFVEVAFELQRIARAIDETRTDYPSPLMGETFETVYQGLSAIAEAIEGKE